MFVVAFYQNPKDIFADALEELLKKCSIEDITVQDITKMASSSRTTFYRYFHDKYDLVAYVYERAAEELVGHGMKDNKDGYALAVDICSIFQSKPLFFKNAFLYTGQNSFFDFFVEYTEKVEYKRLQEKLGTKDLPEDLRLLVKSYVVGVCSVVRSWVLSDMKLSITYIAKICSDACPPRLKDLIG